MTVAMLREAAAPVHPPWSSAAVDIPPSNGNGMKLWDGDRIGTRIYDWSGKVAAMAEDGVDVAHHAERRKRQRFVARRWGSTCFWVSIDGHRLPLNDLSLEGFGVPASAPPAAPRSFPFVLHLDGIPDQIRGEAMTVNFLAAPEGGQLGCRFTSFEEGGDLRLHDWLTVHVIATASVRISEQEAAAIVAGPSLV